MELPIETFLRSQCSQVAELSKLHQLVQSATDDWDRCFAGAVLFCTYARSHWSDFQRGHKLDIDVQERIEFIAYQVAEHKTMHSSAFRFRFLELCASRWGVDGPWIEPWLEARKRCSIHEGHRQAFEAIFDRRVWCMVEPASQPSQRWTQGRLSGIEKTDAVCCGCLREMIPYTECSDLLLNARFCLNTCTQHRSVVVHKVKMLNAAPCLHTLAQSR